MIARENPFASHRVLRIRYRPQDVTWKRLLERLAALDYRAAIVGPQGSGKTTLLEDLGARLAANGFYIAALRLDDRTPFFTRRFLDDFFRHVDERTVILLDGADRMGRLCWWRFRRRTTRAAGLIVATHRAGMLPTLLRCRTDERLLREIVDELLSPSDDIDEPIVKQLFDRHGGNVRDALRELYDLYAVGA